MIKRIIYQILFACFAILLSHQGFSQTRPNIIFILADDLGYGDIEPYGQIMIKTPHLLKMAQEGMKFNNAYSGSPVCAPSRCSLITGRHQGNAYIRANDPSDKRPLGDGVPLREQDSTIAQMLKTAGYSTGMFGKWGLGMQSTTGSPEKKGWDEFYGYLNQAHAHHFYVDSLWRVRYKRIFPERVNSSAYTDDLIMDEACDFIRRNKDQPFFLYLSSLLPHAELQIPRKYMSQYLDSKGQSIFLETPFSGKGSYHRQPNPNAVYASMVSKLDFNIGRIMSTLKYLGIEQNTLVIFASDNGIHAEGGYDGEFFDSNGPLRGKKRDLYEGGIRTPFLVWSPGKIKPASSSNQLIGFWDIWATFADLAGVKRKFNTDGISLWPIMLGGKEIPRDFFYWENHVKWDNLFTQAVLKGDWKAIRFKKEGSPAYVELYYIKNDIGEEFNLAGKFPDKVAELTAIMESASSRPDCEEFVYWKDYLSK